MADKKTPVFDWQNGEFRTDSQGTVLTVAKEKALEQIAIKAHNTPRGVFLIYADPENTELDHKYGSDVLGIVGRKDLSSEVRISEIQRALKETLLYETWVTGITDVNIYETVESGEKKIYADYTLYTIYDNPLYVKGVEISG